MRFSDHLVSVLDDLGVKHCFMVTGGAAMHLNDAFRLSNTISVVCLHNEQSCAMAADAYFKASGRMAAVCVTAGPGALNTLNGVWGAYADSSAMIVIAGQCRTDHIAEEFSGANRPRLFGDQDCPTRAVVSRLVKGFQRVMNPGLDELEGCRELISCALSGRPGPVWIEVPINIQGAELDTGVKDVKSATPKVAKTTRDYSSLAEDFCERLSLATRPAIMVGNGVRFSNTENLILDLATELCIPVLPVWNSIDLVPSDHPCFVGRPGADGDRAGNFVQQRADCLIILGARMHVRQTGFDFESFAREADQVLMVDIDPSEMSKPNLKLTKAYNADLASFIPLVKANLLKKKHYLSAKFVEFLSWARQVHTELPILEEDDARLSSGSGVNPYQFVNQLFLSSDSRVSVITSDGTAAVITQKVAHVLPGRRIITNKGCASMGYELPAVIGVFEARGMPLICIAGDGSIMMNLQELAVISGRKIPVTIFVLNNEGYHSIRQTQQNYFGGNEIGCGMKSGLYFPSFAKLSNAFDIKYDLIKDFSALESFDFSLLHKCEGPRLIEVIVDKAVCFVPRMKTLKAIDNSLFSLPLEDMDPLLAEADLKRFAPNYDRPKIQ